MPRLTSGPCVVETQDFEGEGSESSSDDDMDEDLDEEDSPVVKKKRGPAKPAAATKAAPPAKKPKPSAAKVRTPSVLWKYKATALMHG